MKHLFITLLFSLSSCFLSAHEDPTNVIDVITHKLEKLEQATKADPKKKAELYLQRGVEHLAARNKKLAHLDFKQATKLDPENSEAWLKLSNTGTNKTKLSSSLKAYKTAKNKQQKSRGCHALSECFYSKQNYKSALAFSNLSIDFDKNYLTPLLFKSHLLYMQGNHMERIKFLKAIQKTNPSIVLRNQYIDAMIDSGNADEVRAIIEKELADSRFKSSWHIRLARIDLKNRNSHAKTAITEIKKRLNPKQPDTTLLIDLAKAYQLIGDKKHVKQTITELESLPHDEWQLAELKSNM